MADDSQAIRGISWRETFPFTHLFRTFRVAIHPSKLLLGLTALIVLYVGGQFLDVIWPVKHRAVQDEIVIYQTSRYDPAVNFADGRAAKRGETEMAYANLLMRYDLTKDRAAALAAAANGDRLGELKDKIVADRDALVKKLNDDWDKQKTAVESDPDPAHRDKARAVAETAYRTAVRDAYDDAFNSTEQANQIKNSGVFTEFFSYERTQFNAVITAVKHFDAVDGYHSIERFLAFGPIWLLTQHPIFFFLFLILFAATWAVFGGAIARIAAVHVARDEKLSIRAALRFSSGKFLSFLFAPIIPLLIIAVLGIVLMIASLLVNIPFLGPILAGVFFFLALAIGFVMALVLVGTVGGFNLMYPTIAVEGSDSFDAISRSFSYLYARPWRLAFYTVVSIVYGAITYTFLKLFIALMLKLIHTFAGYGIFRTANDSRPLWDSLWPGPGEFASLTYQLRTLTLGPGESLGAHLIELWVYLVISILGAYAISFYFSSNTIIYYLMRNEVDATDMDDVFIEQQDDDLMESTPSPASAPEAPAPESSASAAPESLDPPPAVS